MVFKYSLHSCILDESSISIERVKVLCINGYIRINYQIMENSLSLSMKFHFQMFSSKFL